MKSIKLLWLIPILGILNISAVASDNHQNVQHRIEKQQKKIHRGVDNGELTKHEAKTLRKEHRHIVKLRKMFMHDGELNWLERRTLKRELAEAKNHIYELKHNDQKRKHHYKQHGNYVSFGKHKMYFNIGKL